MTDCLLPQGYATSNHVVSAPDALAAGWFGDATAVGQAPTWKRKPDGRNQTSPAKKRCLSEGEDCS